MKNRQNATTVEKELGAATAMHRARLGSQVLGRFATQREQAPSPQSVPNIALLLRPVIMLQIGLGQVAPGRHAAGQPDVTADARALADGDPPQNGCTCLLYTSPSPRDRTRSRMPSSA